MSIKGDDLTYRPRFGPGLCDWCGEHAHPDAAEGDQRLVEVRDTKSGEHFFFHGFCAHSVTGAFRGDGRAVPGWEVIWG